MIQLFKNNGDQLYPITIIFNQSLLSLTNCIMTTAHLFLCYELYNPTLQCIIQQAMKTVCAPVDGRNYRPKHVELIGIINKPLLLRLVGCLYYCISDARSYKHQSWIVPQS